MSFQAKQYALVSTNLYRGEKKKDRIEKIKGGKKGSEEEMKFIQKGSSAFKDEEVKNARISLLMLKGGFFLLLKGIYYICKRPYVIVR